MKNAPHDFTRGGIAGPLIRFAIPVLAALFLQAMYGAVDLLVVGQFADKADVSAVATGAHIMMTLTNLVASLAMGATILLGQQIGEGNARKGGESIGACVALIAAVGAALTQLNFDVLWRYFSWSNQTLAMIALWVATAYLIKEGKYRYGSLITALPAAFMSAVSLTYILMAQEGFRLSASIAYPAGLCFAVALFALYIVLLRRKTAARPTMN